MKKLLKKFLAAIAMLSFLTPAIAQEGEQVQKPKTPETVKKEVKKHKKAKAKKHVKKHAKKHVKSKKKTEPPKPAATNQQ
jgi:Flp pilus assembly protein TadB